MLGHLMSKLNRQVFESHIFLASLQWQLGIIQAVSRLDTGAGRRAPLTHPSRPVSWRALVAYSHSGNGENHQSGWLNVLRSDRGAYPFSF
jgi:hypothetical protein